MKLFHRVYSGCLALCLCGMLFRAYAQAQDVPVVVGVRHFSLEQGLPSRGVLTVGQDREGFVWMGTLQSAYRFDGQRFAPLSLPTHLARQQSFNPSINVVKPDRQGNLWVVSSVLSGKRQKYIIKPGQTQAQLVTQAFGHPDPLQADAVYEYVSAPDNSFQYVWTQSGAVWWHKGQDQFRNVFQRPAPGDLFLHETAQQTLLITYSTDETEQNGELFEVDSLGHVLRHHTLPRLFRPVWKEADGTIYLRRHFKHGELVSASTPFLDGFLYRLEPTGKLSPMPITLPRKPVSDLAHYPISELAAYFDAHHGLFWVFGPQMLLAWHPQKGVVFDLATTRFSLESIQKFNQVVVDRTGAVWVCTTNGVLLLSLELIHFQRYLHQNNTSPVGLRWSTRGMVQLGNRLLVNAQETQRVDLKTGHSQFVFQNVPISRSYTVNLCPLVQDQHGTVWSAFSELLRIEPGTLKPFAYKLRWDNTCVTIWPDGRSKLWLGHQQGVSIFNTQRGAHEAFTLYNHYPELAQSRVNGFFPDKRTGMIWIAASSGLYLLDTLRGIQARYRFQGKNSTTSLLDHITYVHPDPEQRAIYWLATRGGLIRWDKQQGTFQVFTQKQGLSDNNLHALYEDHHQRLWLPSNYGLMSFHRKTHQVHIYHVKDGIADEEFNLISHYRAPDGRLFFGGVNGVTAFYPDQIQERTLTPVPLLLTQYQKLNTETGQMDNHFAEFSEQKGLHLTASDRLFSLGFSLLDYRYIGQARLWYRIEGWQDKWVAQSQLELRLNSLPAGDYTIQVRAQTSNGNWASSILSIPVTVDKPVYLRGWFLVLCVLMLAVGVVVVFRWRNRQLMQDKLQLEAEVARRTAQIEEDKAIIERQAADLQASVTLKSRFFANVSHELRTPLTLMLGPIQYLTNRVSDNSAQQLLSVMDRNARQLLTLVNDLLDLTRLDNRQTQLVEQPADLALLVRQTIDNFIPQAHYMGVYLQAIGLDEPVWMALDAPKMETVLRNLLANALHYTSAGGTIQIQLSKTDGLAEIRVTDSGSGIHADDLPHIFERYFQSKQIDKPLRGGTGIGLAICQEYCLLWGGEIRVGSELGKGSTFTITYPIRQVPETSWADRPLEIQPKDGETTSPALVRANAFEELVLPATGKSVLIVEDHADMLLYIQMVLSPQYALLIARNGRQALDLLHKLAADQLPDLIVSDIMMPELDGMALVNALRETKPFAHIPIILLTARIDLETRLQALRLGIADYLTKPFNETELLVRCQHLIDRADEQARLRGQVPDESEGLVETTSDQDAEWIDSLQQLIRKNLTGSVLTIHFLAEVSSLSERQLYRRIRELTGMSPNQFIQEVRLQVAQELLNTQPQAMVKSIGYQVGYQNTSYFIRIYRERFGISPGERSYARVKGLTDKGLIEN